jgi:hypothetical protein
MQVRLFEKEQTTMEELYDQVRPNSGNMNRYYIRQLYEGVTFN